MTTIKQRRADLRKEKKARAAARAAVPKKGTVPKKDPDGSWLDFRGLANEKVEEKIRSLHYEDMLELYKKLEKTVGLRIDPENYKPPVIIRNFMLLWIRNKSDEELKAARGEELIPLTEREIDQVMSNRGLRSRLAPVSDEENNEPF